MTLSLRAARRTDAHDVARIAVDPSHWRSGVGRFLMSDAIGTLALAYQSAILWTLGDYPSGHAFYRHEGWEREGSTRDGGRQVAFHHALHRVELER